MSPEQVRGEPVDQRSDIFAFGCILREMFSGVRAFGRGSAVESMKAIPRDEIFALPVFSSSGHVIHWRQDRANRGIWAFPFSLGRLERLGDPFRLSEYGRVPQRLGPVFEFR